MSTSSRLILAAGSLLILTILVAIAWSFARAPFKNEHLKLDTFVPGDVLVSPVRIKGWARGSMFFEASFPVRVLDAAGSELGLGLATADGDWMTPEFVPFTLPLTFKKSGTKTGLLRFQRHNASGLPALDVTVDVPVRFE